MVAGWIARYHCVQGCNSVLMHIISFWIYLQAPPSNNHVSLHSAAQTCFESDKDSRRSSFI